MDNKFHVRCRPSSGKLDMYILPCPPHYGRAAKFAISGLPLCVGKWGRGNEGMGNGGKKDTRGKGAFVMERDIST